MNKIEKVFDAFRNCITEPKCRNCPWEQCDQFPNQKVDIPVTLALDVIEYLRNQLPLDPYSDGNGSWICGNDCGVVGDTTINGLEIYAKWCPQCGRKVNWGSVWKGCGE